MDFKTKLLNYLHLTPEDYQKLSSPVDVMNLPSFDKFCDMDKAAKIIQKTMENHEKIVIYGDYDCDGIMATSILKKCFQMLNYQVGYYIPSRYIDGYGLNVNRVHNFYDKGYKLIITVDNGIAQFEAIEEAKKLGINVIVTDHHEKQDKLPDADVILHPLVSNYGDVVCCGAYVSFMLASKLLNKYEPYLLSLASIATISDMMSLHEYNRDVVRLGLNYLNANHYYPIDLLAEHQEIDENVIGLKVAPKINSVGRMMENTSINYLVEYFTSDNRNRIDEIYEFISSTNEKRKTLTKESLTNLDVSSEAHTICLISDLKEGIIGLVANNLLNKYHKPAIVFTGDSNDETILKGSARSLKGLAINQFFLLNKDIIINGGGHEQAGGLTIKRSDFDVFVQRFEDYALLHPVIEEEEDFLEISLTDISKDNYEFIRSLAPFGEGFHLPLFKISNIKVSSLTYTKTQLHILYNLSINQKIIGFNYSKDLLAKYDYINIYGSLTHSIFRNNISYEFHIKRLESSEGMPINCQ